MALESDHGQQGVGSATNATPAEDFKHLLNKQEHFAPLPNVLAASAVKDYQTLYDRAAGDLAGFWDKIAKDFTWARPWTRVMEGKAPQTRWF
ncbi:MAG TPA: acetyl-coenzyme A synthetase N-terminal domain-containing protein, partial [Ktedonobacteraceae bacterium]|nr:acetyl-coenzyme A synthetase N-terminal domain-containing protein [Ktedonobacteraceae bacterium]